MATRDRTDSSMSISDIKDAKTLSSRIEELQQLRSDHIKEWALNREFYKGNQWAWFSKYSSRVETLPTEEGEKPAYRARLTVNKIAPGVQHYNAQLTKNRPRIEAVPDTGSDKDIKSAQLATKLYEHWYNEFSLSSKTVSALVHAALSAGYWKISWDPLASSRMKFMINPETGTPIVDEELADAFRDSLEQAGVDPSEFEQVVSLGDIRVEVMPGENVILDPSAKSFEEAQFAVCIHHMSPKEVQTRWPKAGKVKPDSIPSDASPATLGGSIKEPQATSKKVFILYHRPGPVSAKGRYVVWIEDPDKVLVDTDWPFPFDELPLVKFPGLENPDSALDLPIVNAARPIQKEINKTESQIVMHKNLTLRPQMIAPIGSLQQKLTTEPGIVYEYAGQVAPEWRQPPQLPTWLFEHLGSLKQEMADLFNRMPSNRDQLPARIDSGAPIDLIHEAVADQLSATILRLEEALARAGMIMVKLAQKFYIEPRTIRIAGPGGAIRAKKFKNADIDGGFTMHAASMSGLPRTRAGKQARVEFLLTNGLIKPQSALKHLDVADMDGILAQMAADEDHALREHDKLLRGIPLNPTAVQEAMQAVAQGINPQTGQPIASEEEGQAILMQASLMPSAWEDSGTHWETHRLFMTSLEFEGLPPDIQSRFAIHAQLTQQQLAAQQPQPPADKPKVTFNVKGTASAPVAGEIFREAGIDVTDEEVAMPPLETWVTDSMDKPDMDEAGNDPLTQQEQMMAMRREEEKHSLALAKSAHEVALAEKSANAPDMSGEDDRRKEELHQQTLRHKEVSHEEGVRAKRRAAAQKADSGREG